jgi:hypothetical protein
VKARRPSKVQAAQWRAELDLFGEVAVTRDDVYAWLLGVVDLDPSSARAAEYVSSYDVVNKIIRAKLDGTFDELVQPAKHSARLRELSKNGGAVLGARNLLALGEWTRQPVPKLATTSLKAPDRPAAVIRREKRQKQRRLDAKEAMRVSMLARLPDPTPSLSVMLQDLGCPGANLLAHVFEVSQATAASWISKDQAPKAVLLSLFWITRWGASLAEANAHNDAVAAAAKARLLREQVEALQGSLRHLASIADFGAANDPLAPPDGLPRLPRHLEFLQIEVQALQSSLRQMAGIADEHHRATSVGQYPIPPLPVPLPALAEDLIRSAPCADSGNERKSA